MKTYVTPELSTAVLAAESGFAASSSEWYDGANSGEDYQISSEADEEFV